MSDFCTIPLTRGLEAVVDAADYDALSAYRWSAIPSGSGAYACRKFRLNGKHTTVLMHRHILMAPGGLHVDHINRDRLDNRRANLRLCTPSQNSANAPARSSNTSGFKGVSPLSRTSKWGARISVAGVTHNLGSYEDKVEAARAYDAAAKKLLGSFAHLNFPEAV